MEEQQKDHIKQTFKQRKKKVRVRSGLQNKEPLYSITVETPEKDCKENYISTVVKKNEMPLQDHMYSYIGTEIWFLISEFIYPEDVQRFALICRQTAEIVASSKFWTHLYKRFCSNHALEIPKRWETETVLKRSGIRARVIQSLYCTYPLFCKRVRIGYKIDALEGKFYDGSWHNREKSLCVMFFKLIDTQLTLLQRSLKMVGKLPTVTDWESISNDHSSIKNNEVFINKYEGISLLLIYCPTYTPLHCQMMYDPEISNQCPNSSLRLVAVREKLSKNMTDKNLELDFANSLQNKFTVHFSSVLKHKVVPWWHPEFIAYEKCTSV